MTKYCTNSYWGVVDNKLELLPEDDAATAKWGSNWCMPSKDQFDELKNSDYTTIEKTTLNGIDGVKVTSKKNGKTLFFPEAGEYWYENLKKQVRRLLTLSICTAAVGESDLALLGIQFALSALRNNTITEIM